VNESEWRFLVALAAPTRVVPNPAPEWLTEAVWGNLLALSDLPAFHQFDADVIQHVKTYQRYFDSLTPETEQLSAEFEARLTPFQKLLVLRCLRPDKMTNSLQSYVSHQLGAEFIEAPQFSLASSFKDSSPITPLIFILSKGADPASKLFAFASEMGFRDRFQSISLGQGQGTIAAKYIEDGMKKGAWVLLQNCHLALSWLPTLERILLEMNPETCHDGQCSEPEVRCQVVVRDCGPVLTCRFCFFPSLQTSVSSSRPNRLRRSPSRSCNPVSR
jgi:dynein heavy chain